VPSHGAGFTGAGELGKLVRRHREARGLLQEQLAALVEPALSVNTIGNVERGQTRPYRHTLALLAAALGLDAQQRAELVAAWLADGAQPGDVEVNGASSHSKGAAAAADRVLGKEEPALQTPPHNLLAQATALIGREQELTEIATRLRSPDVRLLTLTGTGGIGKTRLALQAAADLLGDYRDGVFCVALAPIAHPALVVSAIAQALGLPDPGGGLRESLRNFLHNMQMLLVLDNFEHLLPAAMLLAELLAEAPRLNMLVTSREVLHLSGERTLDVPPLRLPPRFGQPVLDQLTQYEAVRLFLERALAVKPDLPVTNANIVAAAEICRQLDGLPLAIELAAARVRHVAPDALLPLLEWRLSVLTGGPRDLPARQQTLRTAIAWSYDLLTPREQALFRRLAVFAGGCTLEAIRAVCAFDGACTTIDMLDRVASLIDKSLVRHDARVSGEPRYTMLETVREYGLEQLSTAGEEQAVRARHADYYAALAHRAAPHFLAAEQLIWLARIDDDLDNLRVVLQWLIDHDQRDRGQLLAGSLWYFWSIHSRVSEGSEWLGRMLAGPSGNATSPQTRGRALLALSQIAARQYDIRTCETAIVESLALARRAGDAWTTAMALVRSAWIAQRLDDWSILPRVFAATVEHRRADPSALFEEAVGIFRHLGDDWGRAMCLAFYAEYLVSRDAARARMLSAEAVEIAGRLGERWATGFSFSVLARLDMAAGRLTQARNALEQSLALAGELNDLYNECQRLRVLAQLAMADTRFADALALLERSTANFRLLGNRPRLAHTLHDLAIAARLAGDPNRALEAYHESLAVFQDLDQHGEVAAVWASLGYLLNQPGTHGQALKTFAESLRIFSRLGTELGLATALSGLGQMALDTNCPFDAARLLGAAETLLDRVQAGPHGVLDPSGPGLRGFQFRRDTAHVRELRTRGREAFEAMGREAFEAALDRGRALSTGQAVTLGLEQAQRSADDIVGAAPNG
jgi:predicted ATPase/transcriptional regulator with XRE-family HTH domain